MCIENRRLLRRSEVLELCGISSSTLYDLMALGLFPRPVLIARRAVRWRLEEVLAWIESRPLAAGKTLR